MGYMYIIDGDNNPKLRAAASSFLEPEDRIIAVFTKTSYYSKLDNRNELLSSSKASVEFFEVVKGDQSVDLAVASCAARMIAELDDIEELVLISGDKHFSTICENLKIICKPHLKVVHCESIATHLLFAAKRPSSLALIKFGLSSAKLNEAQNIALVDNLENAIRKEVEAELIAKSAESAKHKLRIVEFNPAKSFWASFFGVAN